MNEDIENQLKAIEDSYDSLLKKSVKEVLESLDIRNEIIHNVESKFITMIIEHRFTSINVEKVHRDNSSITQITFRHQD